MLLLVSPAKKLNMTDPAPVSAQASIRFAQETAQLVDILRGKSQNDIKALMHLSDKLAALNYERYQGFADQYDLDNAKQAVFMFEGDTYKGLDATSLNADDLDFAQGHLRMLSGLYGLLRPYDLVQPYRLEMGTKLPNPNGEDLYDFWDDKITKACIDDAKSLSDQPVIVNLASQEYISSLKQALLKQAGIPFITCHFKEIKDGKAKVVGLFAKRARGMMARYACQNRLTSAQSLKEFTADGYGFDPSLSTDKDYIFTRLSTK